MEKFPEDETASTKSDRETFFCQSTQITQGKFLPEVNCKAKAACSISASTK
ncbi:hypothetical protein H6G41_22770 [Tolypothrix sp. FACHB-123]|uniref:hypothetical protein n=1 Tax=Tolypothrix sp. FACHB-123 TaxID=2692868 RepID=UPI0016838707|nr:hypothetical protein [Tolypothrix sp. FACHB-123]MBD2357406.1 hypothetical protein [Tolypothrix sp. FACHB-123]